VAVPDGCRQYLRFDRKKKNAHTQKKCCESFEGFGGIRLPQANNAATKLSSVPAFISKVPQEKFFQKGSSRKTKSRKDNKR